MNHEYNQMDLKGKLKDLISFQGLKNKPIIEEFTFLMLLL